MINGDQKHFWCGTLSILIKCQKMQKNASRTVVTKDNQIEFKTKKLYCFGQKIGTESFSFHQMPSFIFFIQRSFLFERLVFFSFIIMEP
jgi:hypothetical protein